MFIDHNETCGIDSLVFYGGDLKYSLLGNELLSCLFKFVPLKMFRCNQGYRHYTDYTIQLTFKKNGLWNFNNIYQTWGF